MLPQENEKALIDLLKTNGNCTGKCIGGINPDNMTVQDAVNVMSQWGMVIISKNSLGQSFINLAPTPLYGQVNVYLSVGTWTKEMETIDRVAIRIQGSGSYYVKKDVWLANRGTFSGFRMENILKAYGVPSYVGFDFSSISPTWTPDKGESLEYGMSLHFEQFNLHMLNSAIAYYDGEAVFLCPSKESHALSLEINPERPLKELQNVFPVTWQTLTGTDLNAFYQTFTGGNAFDACVTTNIEKILTMQP
jgi:ribosomal protein L24E